MISVVSRYSSVPWRLARVETIAGRSVFVVAAMLLVSIAGCGGSRVDGAPGEHEPLVAQHSSEATISAEPEQADSDAQATESNKQGDEPAEKSVASITTSESDRGTKTAAASAAKASDQDAKPRSSGSGRIKDLTFDDLKFEMEKEDPFERSLLTPQIEELDGKPIRIRGYILPQSVFTQSGFNRFVLVRDNQECCFGPGAALFDAIVVEMEPGKTADYNIFPVAVEGKFQIKELKGPGGRHLAIYYMLASAVK